MECLMCNGTLVLLGRLGRMEHFECDSCGKIFNGSDGFIVEHDEISELYTEIGGEGG